MELGQSRCRTSRFVLHRALPVGVLFLDEGSAVGVPIQAGLEAGVAHLLDALGRFCDAEGLAASRAALGLLAGLKRMENCLKAFFRRPRKRDIPTRRALSAFSYTPPN